MLRHIALILSLFLYTGSLFAQATMDSDTATVRQIALEEITVRSPKQQSDLRKMPASISVVTARTLENSEVNSLKDLSSAMPNFFMPDYGSKLTSPVYIRGIGSRINSPSVGVYVDNVPYFEKAAFDFDFFDIDRVEVLRGPQGTLYGRNTMGGIINVFTQSPFNGTGSKIKLSAGNYGDYSLGVNHYGQFSPMMGYSINLSGVHRDGFFRNEYSRDNVDKINSGGSRARIVWKISDQSTLENVASFEHSKQGGYPYALYVDSLKDKLHVNYDQYSTYRRDLFSDALVWNHSGDNFNIQSTSSFQYLNDNQSIDQDFTPAKKYFIIQKQNQNMFSQEVVVKSKPLKKYEWLLGAYGFAQQFDNTVDVSYYPSNLNYIKGYDHQIMGAALFHQSTLNNFLLSNLSLTAGVRLDLEKDQLNYTYDVLTTGTWVNKADTVYPTLNNARVTPKFSLNYQAGKSTFYATIANGYKTGGFNTTFERPEDLTFDPEESWNYEIGWRATLLNHLFYADAALFYIHWNNQQVYQTVPSGRGSMLKNAGETKSKGVEFSLRMTPVHGFEANISYGYTDATFFKYIVDETTEYTGNYLPYVPRQTLSASGSKIINLPKGWFNAMKINLSYRGTGKHYWSEKNDTYQNYYGLLDAKISFIKDNFQLEFWGKNINEANYYAFSFEALGNRYVQRGKPTQVGINMIYKF